MCRTCGESAYTIAKATKLFRLSSIAYKDQFRINEKSTMQMSPENSKPNKTNIFPEMFKFKAKISETESNEGILKKSNLYRSLREYFSTDYLTAVNTQQQELEKSGKFKETFIDFTAGSVAGTAQIFTSQPFDTVKVKQQTFPKLYKSTLKCFVYTYRKDGITRGLYAGTLPAIIASVAENSVLFAAYGGCQKVVTSLMDIGEVGELSAFGNACAGFLASFFSTFTLCPTELIKCKLQAVHEMKHYVNKNSKVTPISAIKLTREIFVKEGISGFYRGLLPTFVREMPGYFFFFGGYEAAREYFAQPDQTKYDIGPFKTMCAGAIGGIALWTSTYPADVIKSRMQINNLKGSMWSIGTDMLRKEGVLAFYNGLLPTVLRTIPATATLFLVYEFSKKYLTDKL